MSHRPRRILHADLDAFFAAVEQRDRPELLGRPVVVGGLSERGVVSTASYEARRFGIHSAMPMVEARRRCPEAAYLRGDLSRYARVSRQVFAIFRRFSPCVEGLSLDEAFLDLTGSERLQGSSASVGQALRRAVREELDLRISVGIAPVKLVAKIASDEAKPDGLLEVTAAQVRDFLAPLPVRRLWGVGPKAEARLHRAGFHTLGELAAADGVRLEAVLGDRGRELQCLARGIDPRPVESERAARSFGEENTFAEDVEDRAVLEGTIRRHAEAVARRLRREEVFAGTVVLKLKLATRRREGGAAGYPVYTRQRKLVHATDDGRDLASTALALLDEFHLNEAVRLVGVTAREIQQPGRGQLELGGLLDAAGEAGPTERVRRSEIHRAMDALNDRFGRGAVEYGSQAEVGRSGLHDCVKRGEEEEGE